MGRGREETERVKEMKENFMLHHKEGLSIPEIAKKYDISSRHIYLLLDKIAKDNGLEREDLLGRIHPHHIRAVDSKRKAYPDFPEIQKLAAEILESIENTMLDIDTTIEE